MNHSQLLHDLNIVINSQDHNKLTTFLYDNKNYLLDNTQIDNSINHRVIANILNLSLYNHFIDQGNWSNIIAEVNIQYQLQQMLDQPISNPSCRIMCAVIDAFKLCYSMTIPVHTKRILTLLSDHQILMLISHWVLNTQTDIYVLKNKGYLSTDDIKEILNFTLDGTAANLHTTFKNIRFTKGPLQDWFLTLPIIHPNIKMIDIMWCYQGMGWVAKLSECIKADNSRKLLIRMDGGSDWNSVNSNNTFFLNIDPTNFNLVNWSEFLDAAPQILTDQPSFNHPNVISAP
uniref:Uncharacterized protein n=1 Tax=viral metagenome TaxID=1070528 RepID=A0A6C0E8E5_9ZZZZ